MRKLMLLAALMPFAALAIPLNPTNNPNQPGYVNPSQQRLQNEMHTQQMQQQRTINEQLQTQVQQQRQRLHSQFDNNQQQVVPAGRGQMMPGSREQSGRMLSLPPASPVIPSPSQR